MEKSNNQNKNLQENYKSIESIQMDYLKQIKQLEFQLDQEAIDKNKLVKEFQDKQNNISLQYENIIYAMKEEYSEINANLKNNIQKLKNNVQVLEQRLEESNQIVEDMQSDNRNHSIAEQYQKLLDEERSELNDLIERNVKLENQLTDTKFYYETRIEELSRIIEMNRLKFNNVIKTLQNRINKNNIPSERLKNFEMLMKKYLETFENHCLDINQLEISLNYASKSENDDFTEILRNISEKNEDMLRLIKNIIFLVESLKSK